MNSKALTKIQSVALIAIIVAAAVGGSDAYVLWQASLPPPEDIRIGICADLDATSGTAYFRSATLAIEQINAAGGLLGRNLTLVTEDDDSSTPPFDIAVATNALNKLITVDKADYIIASPGYVGPLVYQDICCAQRKILFTIAVPLEDLTQRVLDNYDKYKYCFRAEPLANGTRMDMAHIQALGAIKNATGFTKLGYLLVDSSTIRQNTIPQFESELPKLGFQIVYRGLYPMTVTDFTSYFSQAETAKAQILFVIGLGINKCAAIVNEWYNQESPMVLCGDMPGVADPDFWNTTHGNTECVLTKSTGLALSIPITNETIPAANAFLARWGVPMRDYGAAAYDIVKFFLADAITKAGTTDTNAVINALETTNVDTVLSRGFRFTSNHDIYVDVAGMTSASQSSILYIVAQWQNGVQVPVFPEALRIEAGATYKFPSWKGPWS